MSEKKESNGHSRPEDFLLEDYPEFRSETLPSGLKVKLRQLNRLEFYVIMGSVPGNLAAVARGAAAQTPTPEEMITWSYRVLSTLIAEPKFSPEPKEGEFHPRRLKGDDQEWLMAYFNRFSSGGGGADLETFRERPSGAGDGDSAGSGGVPRSAEPASGKAG